MGAVNRDGGEKEDHGGRREGSTGAFFHDSYGEHVDESSFQLRTTRGLFVRATSCIRFAIQ